MLSQDDKKECKKIILFGLGTFLALMGASCMGVIC